MSDLAPNWTPRIRVRYRVQSRNHSFLFRMKRDQGEANLASYIGKIESWLAAVQASLYSDFAVQGCEWAAVDSDVFLPTTPPDSPTGALSTSGRPGNQQSLGVTFTGRASSGAKWKVTLFGFGTLPAHTSGDDWVILPAENAAVAAGITALSELAPTVKAIDGTDVSIYPRALLKHFDHWVTKARQGA